MIYGDQLWVFNDMNGTERYSDGFVGTLKFFLSVLHTHLERDVCIKTNLGSIKCVSFHTISTIQEDVLKVASGVLL